MCGRYLGILIVYSIIRPHDLLGSSILCLHGSSGSRRRRDGTHVFEQCLSLLPQSWEYRHPCSSRTVCTWGNLCS